MTEQEYIDATDLEKVRSAKESLIRIIPENSSVITKVSYEKLISVIYQWEEQLYKTIKIKH